MRIRNAETLTGHGSTKLRRDVVAILEAGMTAADPYDNTLDLVRIEDGFLVVGGDDFEPAGTPRPGLVRLDLDKVGRIFVFGAGKGIQRAAEALEKALGERLTGGHIIIKYGDTAVLEKITYTHGAHPVPDENCVAGCRRMVDTIREAGLTKDDVVFTIVGNGVSSLLTLPAGDLPLEWIKEVTRVLQMEKGALTMELNNVRNALDSLKSGRLTRLLHPARMFHLLTIDPNKGSTGTMEGYRGLTEGNYWLHTLPDYTSRQLAVDTLRRFGVWDDLPDGLRAFLENPDANAAPLTKAEFEAMDCRIYGVVPYRRGVWPTVAAKARELGYEPHILSKIDGVEASEAGMFMAGMARLVVEEGIPFRAPCALFMAGEKVVTVGRADGVGGRNQEFCLAAARVIAGLDRVAAGSVDTDGTDGPGGDFDAAATQAGVVALAGGVVDGATQARAEERGYDLVRVLASHAASKPLWDLGDGVWAVHSISVNDCTVVLVDGP